MDELLNNLKKNCEDLQKEFKKIQTINDQLKMLEKNKAFLIKEIEVLQSEKANLSEFIKNEHAGQLSRIKDKEFKLDEQAIEMKKLKDHAYSELINAQALKLRAEAELSEAMKIKEESREVVRIYTEKLDGLKKFANA